MSRFFTIFQGEDGIFRAEIDKRIASRMGHMAASFIQAQSEETAKELAGIAVRGVIDGSINIKKPRMRKSDDIEPVADNPSLF